MRPGVTWSDVFPGLPKSFVPGQLHAWPRTYVPSEWPTADALVILAPIDAAQVRVFDLDIRVDTPHAGRLSSGLVHPYRVDRRQAAIRRSEQASRHPNRDDAQSGR